MIKKRYTIIFITVLFLSLLFFPAENIEGSGVNIEIIEPEVRETLPGVTKTISLRIENKTEKEVSMQGEVELPEGFTQLTPSPKFSLSPGESTINLLNLQIASNTVAGTHPINYRLKEGEEIITEKDINLKVLSKPELKITARKAPPYIIAGEEYEVEFRVHNTGNALLTTKNRLEDRLGYSLELDREQLTLSPGEVEKVTAYIKTDKDINRGITHRPRLVVTAITEDEKEITASTGTSVDILSHISGIDDPYYRLPVTVGTDFSYRGDLGVQFDIAAQGLINYEKKEWVDIYLRPPALEITGDDFSESSPEYRFSYWGEHRRIDVGDHSFSLSDLTESNVSGRGVGFSTEEIEDIEVGGYYRYDIDEDEDGIAGYLDYYPREDIELNIGYLSRKEEGKRDQMFTLGSEFTLQEGDEEGDFELEYSKGLGEREGQAYSGDVDGSFKDLSYSLGYLHSEPDFPGRISDRKSYRLSLGYPFTDNLSVAGAYGVRENNLDLDPDQEALKRRSYSTDITYSFNNTSIDLSHSQSWEKDRHPDPETDEKSKTWGMGIDHSLEKGNLGASYSRSWVEDMLVNEERVYNRLRISGEYNPVDWQNYGADYRLRINEEETKHWGSIDANFEITEDLDLDLDYSRWYEIENNNENEEAPEGSGRDRFKAGITKVLPKQQAQFSAEGSYTRRDDEDGEYSIRAEYSQDIEFGIPVDKRPVGRLKGRIYDAQDPAQPGLEGVIVRIDGLTAVTDEDGYYKFPDLQPGNYHLQVDKNTLEPGQVVDETLPLSFSIEAEEEIEIDLGVVAGSSISGQALVYTPVGGNNNNGINNNNNFNNNSDDEDNPDDSEEDEEKEENSSNNYFNNNNNNNNNLQGETSGNNSIILNQGVEMEPDYGLSGLQLVLRNEDNGESKIEYTVSSGEFSFNDLRPGSWELVINDNGNLPEHHELEDDNFNFDIEPGDKIDDVEIRIVPTERELEFIDEGEILNPNNNEDD